MSVLTFMYALTILACLVQFFVYFFDFVCFFYEELLTIIEHCQEESAVDEEGTNDEERSNEEESDEEETSDEEEEMSDEEEEMSDEEASEEEEASDDEDKEDTKGKGEASDDEDDEEDTKGKGEASDDEDDEDKEDTKGKGEASVEEDFEPWKLNLIRYFFRHNCLLLDIAQMNVPFIFELFLDGTVKSSDSASNEFSEGVSVILRDGKILVKQDLYKKALENINAYDQGFLKFVITEMHKVERYNGKFHELLSEGWKDKLTHEG